MFGTLYWENINENKFIGKTKCGTYTAEIYSSENRWHYNIYRNGTIYIYTKRNNPDESFESVKEKVETLVSLNYVHI